MRTLLAVAAFLLFFAAVSTPIQAERQQTVSAAVAAWRMPRAKLKDLVRAGMRVFVSEAGFSSVVDEAMILTSFINRASNKDRKATNQRLMYMMVAISNRTFPEGSPFLPPGYGAKTRRQSWVSGINLACTEPPAWSDVNDIPWKSRRADSVTGEWLPSYQQLCVDLRKRTWKRMKDGEKSPWCEARVDHWGGAMDLRNPKRGKWVRINCDNPEVASTCPAAREAYPKKPSMWPVGCTRNIGWCDPDLDQRHGNSCPPVSEFAQAQTETNTSLAGL